MLYNKWTPVKKTDKLENQTDKKYTNIYFFIYYFFSSKRSSNYKLIFLFRMKNN